MEMWGVRVGKTWWDVVRHMKSSDLLQEGHGPKARQIVDHRRVFCRWISFIRFFTNVQNIFWPSYGGRSPPWIRQGWCNVMYVVVRVGDGSKCSSTTRQCACRPRRRWGTTTSPTSSSVDRRISPTDDHPPRTRRTHARSAPAQTRSFPLGREARRLSWWRGPCVWWISIPFLFLLCPFPFSRYCSIHVSPIPFPTRRPVLLPVSLAKRSYLLDTLPREKWQPVATLVSRYQKGKTSLGLNEARGDGVLGCQWHQLGMQTICTSLQRDNHTNTPSLNFYRPDALPDAQPTVSMQWSM